MKIEQYDLSLASARVYEKKDQESEALQEWGTKKKEQDSVERPERHRSRRNHDRVSLSHQARREFASRMQQKNVNEQTDASSSVEEEDQSLDSRMMTLKRMIEAFTGKEIKLSHVRGSGNSPAGNESTVITPSESPPPQETPAPQEQAWGMSYTQYSSHYEYEKTSFSASGTVKTADGKEISFSMGLEMSREYFSEERLTVTAGAPLIDPLVINYSGKAAELQDLSFEFDLNSDGKTDTLNQLSPGNGFLVFDRNKDGLVNDGSELFGPSTGDGFAELSAYDDDKNNWIDENDSIYTKLSLFRRDNGVDYLQGLKAANVGAIYLGNADTSFDLTNETNDLLGRVQKTGVYLKEDGQSGTVQQIDFSA
ncbi:MAG: VCBS repeat-containing protein [Proteobacteria bacterium]|nr:VCBS repeat-containing protein [Pseudomonadota bacterium]